MEDEDPEEEPMDDADPEEESKENVVSKGIVEDKT